MPRANVIKIHKMIKAMTFDDYVLWMSRSIYSIDTRKQCFQCYK